MCLIVFSYKNHKKYPFILAGNRDEFYDRPTKKAHFWDSEPTILAGRDLKAGGTWLGISKQGYFGALTNYRNFHNPREGERSRGELVPRFLIHDGNPKEALREIVADGKQYDGFNMIAGSTQKLFYLSNIKNEVEGISPGIHGISNAFLNTSWPKVETAKSEFRHLVEEDEIDEEAIFELLQNSKTYSPERLPDTGLSPEMEKAVSPIFIKTEDYGTRCSSLLMIDNKGIVTFIERTYPVGDVRQKVEKRFRFVIGDD